MKTRTHLRFLALACALVVTAPAVFAQSGQGPLLTTVSTAVDIHALPLGDGKYADSPKAGYVFACIPDKMYALVTGSSKIGSWIHGTTWDMTEKPSVRGEVAWPEASIAIATTATGRIIMSNNLPVNNTTGIFPIEESDPVYPYDHNPNPVTAQNIVLSLPRNPTIAEEPSCIMLPVGISLDGVLFFSALDSHGRDEPAYEMQDRCSGLAAPDGYYHRYMPTDCLPHVHENNALVGYALDGFGIFSPFDAAGNEITTADLDECHGTTSLIPWDGEMVEMYHYVLTRDFPYSIGCLRGTPVDFALPMPPFSVLVFSFVASNATAFAIVAVLLIVAIGYGIFRRKKK